MIRNAVRRSNPSLEGPGNAQGFKSDAFASPVLPAGGRSPGEGREGDGREDRMRPMTAAASPALAPTMRMVAAIGALLLTLAILLGGRVPEAVQMMSRFSDKLLHATVYGLLAGFWCIALGGRHRSGAVAAAVCTGLLDEWLQRSLPGRQADMMDLVADALGASARAWLALPVMARLQQVPAWMRAAAVYSALVFGAGLLSGSFSSAGISAPGSPATGCCWCFRLRWPLRRACMRRLPGALPMAAL